MRNESVGDCLWDISGTIVRRVWEDDVDERIERWLERTEQDASEKSVRHVACGHCRKADKHPHHHHHHHCHQHRQVIKVPDAYSCKQADLYKWAAKARLASARGE